jgi:alpha-ketoglutarate-dependent taurine dioxygenase
MVAGDLRARRVVAFFEAARDSAERYDWTATGKVLAIDNRRVLHARASTEAEPERTMHRVTLNLPGEIK